MTTNALKAMWEDVEKSFYEELKKAFNSPHKSFVVRRWIPCSERMPESDGTLRGYIVSIGYWVGIMSCFNGKFVQCVNGKLEEPKYPVEAWMPLPEPYREERYD